MECPTAPNSIAAFLSSSAFREQMKTRAPSSASALAQAITEALLEANPVQGTAKAAESGPRERVLTEAELRKLWAALGQNWYSDILKASFNNNGLMAWIRRISLTPKHTRPGR
jgi:hypothetical protein